MVYGVDHLVSVAIEGEPVAIDLSHAGQNPFPDPEPARGARHRVGPPLVRARLAAGPSLRPGGVQRDGGARCVRKFIEGR